MKTVTEIFQFNIPMPHKQWLDNEYSEWVKALAESTVHNFKEHPMVKRMLGEVDRLLWKDKVNIGGYNIQAIKKIDTIEQIGQPYGAVISGTTWRYIYYAQQILARNPSSICEIGGGVGQFYAILRALGYKGTLYIEDRLDVQVFQRKYLTEVEKQTGLDLPLDENLVPDMVVSFYALGEFDDVVKEEYFGPYINQIPHGYIAWNPHSGATDDLSLFKHDIKVTPGIESGIKIIEW